MKQAVLVIRVSPTLTCKPIEVIDGALYGGKQKYSLADISIVLIVPVSIDISSYPRPGSVSLVKNKYPAQ